MKINGRKIEGPNVEIVVFPRPNGDVVFKAQGVLETEDFEKLCPAPKPPMKLLKGGKKVENVEDATYKAQVKDWNAKQLDWLFLKSLEPTKIEWSTVDLARPETWNNYQTELKEAGFSTVEINKLLLAVMTANSLNESKLEEARERFLRGPEETPSDAL
jgi:hypothetical protein